MLANDGKFNYCPLVSVCGESFLLYTVRMPESIAHVHSYFLLCSHLNKTTTYEDPRKDWGEEPPQPREVELARHPELGFGFVAGSEKPVIVRYLIYFGCLT